MFNRTLPAAATALLVAAAFASPAAAQDLRSPDARDAASTPTGQTIQPVTIDVRSPDARDAATPRTGDSAEPVMVDLRSPDAVDAGTAHVETLPVSAPVTVVAANGAPTGWIIATIALSLLLVIVTGRAGRRHFRQQRPLAG